MYYTLTTNELTDLLIKSEATTYSISACVEIAEIIEDLENEYGEDTKFDIQIINQQFLEYESATMALTDLFNRIMFPSSEKRAIEQLEKEGYMVKQLENSVLVFIY